MIHYQKNVSFNNLLKTFCHMIQHIYLKIIPLLSASLFFGFLANFEIVIVLEAFSPLCGNRFTGLIKYGCTICAAAHETKLVAKRLSTIRWVGKSGSNNTVGLRGTGCLSSHLGTFKLS